jgi:hypothetical protein
MQNKFVRWLFVVIWMIVIFAFSHQPYSGRETEKYLGGMNVPVRKMGHLGEYMILFLLVRWALTKPAIKSEEDTSTRSGTTSGDSTKTRNILVSPSVIAFAIAIAYAGSDEWHQSYVPGRSASWTDVAVDAFGVSIGAVALSGVRKIRKFRS